MSTWTTPTLEGRIVRLEPLGRRQLDDLIAASRSEQVWRWLPIDRPDEAGMFAWLEDALRRAEEGLELSFATISLATGHAIGSTRYLALRPEHRSLEIGWTWLDAAAWGTGANIEAKLLQLEHAFDAWGCRRVEFKTDALNERSRAALAALGCRFEGIHEKHMLVRGGVNRDSARYAILDDDWPAVRRILSRRLDTHGPVEAPGRTSVTVEHLLEAHWPAVARIYREGIETGEATFETDVPPWERWDASHLGPHRLVAVIDGEVAGWAALAGVSDRCVHNGVAESSVYVAAEQRGKGVGKALLTALITSSAASGIWTVEAGIFAENLAGVRLHQSVGFRVVGVRERLGRLHGVWRDVLLLERRSSAVR